MFKPRKENATRRYSEIRKTMTEEKRENTNTFADKENILRHTVRQ